MAKYYKTQLPAPKYKIGQKVYYIHLTVNFFSHQVVETKVENTVWSTGEKSAIVVYMLEDSTNYKEDELYSSHIDAKNALHNLLEKLIQAKEKQTTK